jgi:hypothetical protein
MAGDGNHILPTQRGVGDNDFFSLGHLEPHTNSVDYWNLVARGFIPVRLRSSRKTITRVMPEKLWW